MFRGLTTRMTSKKPASRTEDSTYCRMVLSRMGSIGLGVVSVKGRRRLPNPAAKIMMGTSLILIASFN